MSPAVQVHDLPERIIGLLPPILSTSARESPFHIGAEDAGQRPEISPVAGGIKEAILIMLKSSDPGFQFMPLIRVAIYHGYTGRHPNSAEVTHSFFFNNAFLERLLK